MNYKDMCVGEWNYSYDLAGNLVSQAGGGGNLISGDGYFREYNSLNQLTRIRNGSSADSPLLEQYYYDPYGQRVKIWRNDTAGTVVYTPFRELMQVRNSSGVYNYTYIYDGSTLVARVEPDQSVHFYHPDHLGSTSLITDADGNAIETTFYEPFGTIISGGQVDVKLYTGQFSDEATSQYYYGARYYKPYWGKFVQADPIIQQTYDPQFLNHYAYARNNPFLFVDPDGKNARVYINKEAAPVPLLGYQGHMMIGIDELTNPSNEVLFNLELGQTPNFGDSISNDGALASAIKLALVETGQLEVVGTERLREKFRNDRSDVILPEGFDDYFEIEQEPILDALMVQKGREQNSKRWNYDPYWENSQDYVTNVIEAGGYDVYGKGTFTFHIPSNTFDANKNRKWESKKNTRVYYIWDSGYSNNDKSYCKSCGGLKKVKR